MHKTIRLLSLSHGYTGSDEYLQHYVYVVECFDPVVLQNAMLLKP